MKITRTIPVLLITAASAGLTACGYGGGGSCNDPEVKVSLAQVSEDVRALPVLASGKVNLLGINVPDTHGDARVAVKITNASSVTIEQLAFEQKIDGVVRDIQLTSQQQGDQDVKAGDRAVKDATLKFQWRMKNLADYLLPAAKGHTGKVVLNWKSTTCPSYSGAATLEVPGSIKAVASATNFKLVPGSVEAFRADTLKGSKAKFQLQSAVGDGLTNIKDAKIQVTYFTDGTLPSIGLGMVDSSKIALQTNQQATTSLPVSGTLDVYTSTASTSSPAPYDHAGQAASTGALRDVGKAVVTLTITSAKQSQPNVTQVDTVTELVDYQ